ncbi:uncharacterized protein LOC135814198 [Sycon ciliatum]|uniref:uncharacterized protein LOC135814198 n=1 Tax=Sycon ciliatum TaxID=27933 RepID=UPI0031F67BE4
MDEKSGFASSGSSMASNDGAIYHGVSPSKKLALQVFFICVALAVLASLVVCFVLGSTERTLYMLGVNQCITLANCLVLLKWYKSGTLPQTWLWYLVMVGVFLVIQSAITDIMVGEYPYSPATTQPPPTTYPPIITTIPSNMTNTTTPRPVTTTTNSSNASAIFGYEPMALVF